MTVPILPLYIIGILLFIFGLEDTDKIRSMIYFGIAFFSSYMGYMLSYGDADFVQAAYFPLAVLVLSVVMLIYQGWHLIPHDLSWKEQAENDED